MAADRQRLAQALAAEAARRKMFESIPEAAGQGLPQAPEATNYGRDLENLSIGLGRGAVNQLQGLKGAISSPVETIKGLATGAMEAVRNPRMIAEALKRQGERAISGPLGLGEVIGENVNIVRMPKGVDKREIFIGKSAKTWNPQTAEQAIKMEAAGVDPETIWRETGTFRSPDGQLRQEILDEMAFKPKFGLEGGRSRAYDVNEAVFHPAMRKAYPDIMEKTLTTVRYKPDVPESGYYSPGVPGTHQYFGQEPEIMVAGRNRDEMKSVMAHELQHAVQEQEGFSRGGNPDQFSLMSKVEREESIGRLRNKIAEMAAKRHKDAEFVFSGLERGKPETLADPEIRDLMYELKRMETMADPREQYKRLAGEAEARATQARRGMTMQERRASFPLKSYDVPINELIK